MKITEIAKGVFNAAKRKSPEILLSAGVVGIVVTVVTACRATLKVNEVLDEHKETMEKIRNYPESEKYSEADRKKDTTITYIQTGFKLAKLYALSVGCGALTVTAFLAGHNIMRKRNVALSAAYTAVSKAFNEYRERVKKKFGDEVEKDILLGIEEVEVEEKVVDEKGKEKTQKTKKKVPNGKGNGFVKYITKANPYYSSNKSYFENWANLLQRHLNDKLKAHQIGGFCTLYLNDVWSDMALGEEVEAIDEGWIYDLRNPFGDNYVQLNCEAVDLPNENTGEFEPAYAVWFNTDGNITEELKRRKAELAAA